ncbi:Gfo/Idh/MocA family protein [Marinivivus vitaminiproducens]|uniref:Gfo/Idh/MocA family protein n=1 Tax=Marinivivus vitaminiproducens TaxID=3035935 RepID=UPI00279B1456|nr:Gfo/Idh/MocA family oxidoreductase [Geminicoccaceae bacterium SCSIO 64248]
MQPVKWGILSTANIGWRKVVPAMLRSSEIAVVAVGSRKLETARAMADELGIPRAYGSYEELLADPEIEAVYNPLPNHLHVPLTLQAAEAGKAVLCEKPIAMTAEEAEQLKDAAGKVLIAEAFMIRHHPQWQEARRLVRSGELGTLRSINLTFAYTNLDPDNVRNKADIGGGGLLDIGCYAVVTGRYLFDAEPLRVIALIERDPTFRTDRNASVLLDFGESRQMTFTCSTQTAPCQHVRVNGTKARLEILTPYNAPPDTATALVLDDGSQLGGASARRIEIPAADQYRLQAEAFGRALRKGEPNEYGLVDALDTMRVLDAIVRSERSGHWEAP